MRSWTVQTEKYVIQDAHGYSRGKFGWPEEVVWPRISAEEQGGWSWHWWGGLHAGWHFQVSFDLDEPFTPWKRNMNILLFRIRDETLLFLQQFGKSDRAVISGVIIFTLIYLKILPCFDGQIFQMVTYCSAVESDNGRGNIPHQLWLKYKWGDEPRGKYFW